MRPTSPRPQENLPNPSRPRGGFFYAQLQAQQIAAAAATRANQARRERVAEMANGQRPAFDHAAFTARKRQEHRRREAAARLPW